MSHVDDGTLHAYLDGELSPPEAQGVEAHVAQCPACRERLAEERALIARATELLARAAPPERDLPPFRPGDSQPPVRLWWQVRLPLAWAATIALALGIGTYVGERKVGRPLLEQVPPATPTTVADRLAPNAPPSAIARTRDNEAALKRQRAPERRGRASQPAAPPDSVAAVEEKRKEERIPQASADSIAVRESNALAVRESPPTVAGGQHMAAKAAAPAPAPAAPAPAPAPTPGHLGMMRVGDHGYTLKGDLIGVDSARALLGRDPLVVPDAPILGMYRARMLGYSGVIVEQALDSSTVIEVINARPASLQLGAIVVTGAAEARADSERRGAPTQIDRPVEKTDSTLSGFSVEIVGPVSADSLAALRRLLRPLQP
jgi:Putative zinc-finger